MQAHHNKQTDEAEDVVAEIMRHFGTTDEHYFETKLRYLYMGDALLQLMLFMGYPFLSMVILTKILNMFAFSYWGLIGFYCVFWGMVGGLFILAFRSGLLSIVATTKTNLVISLSRRLVEIEKGQNNKKDELLVLSDLQKSGKIFINGEAISETHFATKLTPYHFPFITSGTNNAKIAKRSDLIAAGYEIKP